MTTPVPFAEDPPRNAEPGDTLVISLHSYEGPLDLLLTLARTQKIDLAAIPILPLVDQYLAYIAQARQLKLEIAADYLVMAAWLAYLKSALLLPAEAKPDPDPDDLAQRLRWRLLRLDTMRTAAEQLIRRDQLGRDTFTRGNPEGLRQIRTSKVDATLYDLLSSYGKIRARARATPWSPPPRAIITLEEALERLSTLIGTALDWTDLKTFLPPNLSPALTRSALASNFAAALELTRTGKTSLAQSTPFGPLLLRTR